HFIGHSAAFDGGAARGGSREWLGAGSAGVEAGSSRGAALRMSLGNNGRQLQIASDCRSRKAESECGSQNEEVRGQNEEVRGQNEEVRGQNAEVRGQNAEVRGQNAEVTSIRVSPPSALARSSCGV